LRTQRFQPRGQSFVAQPFTVGGGGGGVEFDQHLPQRDRLPIAHMDRLDHGGLHRLDDLGAIIGDDLSDRDSDHINPAKEGPQQGDQGEGYDEPQRDSWCGVYRRVTQGKRGGQELGFVGLQRGAGRFAAP